METKEAKPQHLIELRASNFKRLSAVQISVDPAKPTGVIALVGKNAAGKSSVLDAITAALCGERVAPDKPVKTGASKAKIVLRTEELIVTRTFTDNGGEIGGGLTVKDADGRVFSTPQKLLDKLCATVGFDPLSFSRMDPKKQAEQLLKVCPVELDLAKNAADQKEAYEARRDWNRSAKDARAQVDALPELGDDVPTTEVSIAALSQELSRLNGRRRDIDQSASKIAELQTRIESGSEQIQQLKERISRIEADQKAWGREIDELTVNPSEIETIENEAKRTESSIQTAEATNRKVRVKLARAKAEEQLANIEAKAAAAEKRYGELTDARSSALKSAKFPVDGLSLDADGNVTLHGVPFSQASTAEQIKIGVALAAAGEPTLKLAFVRDGSLLDSDSMKVLAEMAEKHGLQVLIERVEDSSPSAIEIVDGCTKGAVVEEESKDEPTEQKTTTKKSKKTSSAPNSSAANLFL